MVRGQATDGSGLSGILSRLTRRAPTSTQGIEVLIDADDILEVWERFPELDPEAKTRGDLPADLLVVDGAALTALGRALESAAKPFAASLAGSIDELAAAWEGASSAEPWSSVAETLVAAIGLGCAVPRLVSWRQPVAFALDHAGAGSQVTPDGPPFLRLSFLAGSGAAGIALLTSRSWPAAAALAAAARNREFAQIFADYEDRDSELTGYGVTGPALVTAGICQRRGVSMQPRLTIAVPVLGLADFVRAAEPWQDFLAAARTAADAARDDLTRAAEDSLVGGGPADRLDVAYFALADLVYDQLRSNGSLPEPKTAASLPKALTVRAVLLEQPSGIWAWLCGDRAQER